MTLNPNWLAPSPSQNGWDGLQTWRNTSGSCGAYHLS